jgi:two-component system NtrC family sensor kinase
LPDIILMDVMMPQMDGMEVCRRLKADERTKGIPVIFISANTEIQNLIDGFAAGGVDYINKPIRREEVLVRVRNHLEIVALFEIQQQLSQAMSEKNAQIVQTQQQLVQAEKMASLGTLTAGVAHEINNPNNFVNVGSQNLRVDVGRCHQFMIDLAGDNADEAILAEFRLQFAPLYEHIDTIIGGSERIKAIVEDLRTFTQFGSFVEKTVNISECLRATVNLVREKYRKVTDFVLDLDLNTTLHCFPTQLNQVFINLIINACDAIKASQAAVTNPKEWQIGTVTITCQQHDEHIELKFKDDGCGMSEPTLGKLFEPFYTTKEIGEGSGLGLSVSWGVVEQHQGQLDVSSELGVGTCFTLLLPLGRE